MDDLADSLGQLSTNAKEWKPGQGYASASASTPTLVPPSLSSTPHASASTSTSSPRWNPHAEYIPPSAAPQSQLWQPPTPATATSAATAGLPDQPSAHQASNQFLLHTHNHHPTRSLPHLGLPSYNLWNQYRIRTHTTASQLPPNDERYKAIPPQYTHAQILDDHKSSFGYPSSGVYKVRSKHNGHLYCLRRLDNVRSVNSTIAHAVFGAWERAVVPRSGGPGIYQSANSSGGGGGATPGQVMPVLHHVGLVRWHRIVVPNRQSVVFVHDYHPGAWTLYECLWNRSTRQRRTESSQQPQHLEFTPLSEGLIWSYATQLISAIQTVHAGNLGVRTLGLNRILVTPELGSGMEEGAMGPAGAAASASIRPMVTLTHRVRLRINCIGVLDALEFEARKSVPEVQAYDIECLGRILLSLTSGMEIGPDTEWEVIQRCESYIRSKYSASLVELTLACIGRSRGGQGRGPPPTMEWISAQVAQPALEELDSAHTVMDGMDAALAAEYESARGLRLLLKLGFVNERPEFGVDSRWSESGDCYVLKLFRDYVFHQADECGRPVMDLGHVVSALNKLDSADDEKIVLSSRDGKSVLVVSFADVARCLDNAYAELCAGASNVSHRHMGDPSAGGGYMGHI